MTVPAFAGDAVFGTFALDPATASGGERCAVFSLEDVGGGKFRYDAARIDAAGKLQTQAGIFAFDGADRPAGDGTLAFTRIDEWRYAVVAKGTLRFTAVRTLSGDGKTLDETADGTGDGEAFHALRVYTRQNGVCTP